MKTATLVVTYQENRGVYFGNYEVYQTSEGYTTYSLETGIQQDFTSLEDLYAHFNADKSVVSSEYLPELKDS